MPRKKILIVFALLISFISVNAQDVLTLEELIKDVEQTAKKRQKVTKSSVEIDEKYFNETIQDLEIEVSPTGSISLVKKRDELNDNVIFHLVKRDGIYKGMALDCTSNVGYEIIGGENGAILFVERPKSKLLFICGEDHDEHEGHDHQRSSVHANKGVSDYIGNGAEASSVFKLQSKPGAPNVIYLDFDGEDDLPGWSYEYTTSKYENNTIKILWETAAEDYIAFDVNVTTDRAVFDAAPLANKQMVVFADFKDVHWLGVAMMNSFGTGTPCLVDGGPKGGFYGTSATTASHEVGHTLSLSHDGYNDGYFRTYYGGHFTYSPLMGNGGGSDSHWSKGEYDYATNKEDDIAIIGGQLGFRQDDYTGAKELTVLVNDSVLGRDNDGIIESSIDVDEFTFELLESGTVSLTVGSNIFYTNLNVLVKLYDSNDNLIASDNPLNDNTASINESLTAGVYSLTIEGAGQLTANDGYTDYGSWGHYQISGNVSGTENLANDIAALSIEDVEEICASTYTPRLEVLNNGLNTISSFTVNVYIDNAFDHAETINETILSGQKKLISLEEVTELGTHDIKFVLDMPNDLKTNNNELIGSYTLIDGKEVQFVTDFQDLNYDDLFTWKIENLFNQEVINSASLNVQKESGNLVQNYCIAEGCYNMVVSGGFNLCSAYDEYTPGTYVTGDIVSYEGYVYEAKYWNQSTPPSTEWEYIGECNEGFYTYQLEEKESGAVLVEGNSTSYVEGQSEQFCVNVITSTENNSSEGKIRVFPNPNTGTFTVYSPTENGSVEVLNSLGQVLEQKEFSAKTAQVSISLKSGVYIVKVLSEEKSYTSKIVIE